MCLASFCKTQINTHTYFFFFKVRYISQSTAQYFISVHSRICHYALYHQLLIEFTSSKPLFLYFLCFNLVTFKVPSFLFRNLALPLPLPGKTLHRTLIYKADANWAFIKAEIMDWGFIFTFPFFLPAHLPSAVLRHSEKTRHNKRHSENCHFHQPRGCPSPV